MQIDKNNWQIKIDKDNLLEIRRFVKNNINIDGGSYGHYLICSNEHITISPCKTTRCYNIPIITTEQFLKYILGKDEVASKGATIWDELIRQPERKIIGYKAPFDMYCGEIKMGDLFEPIGSSSYVNKSGPSYVLPKELVELYFTPVYEEEKVIELHGWKVTKDKILNIEGTDCRGLIFKCFKEYSEIIKAYEELNK